MSPVAQYIVQAGMTLVAIALLAWLLLVASRRLSHLPAKGPLELLGRLPLEGRRAVYLVRVGGRVLVLAATDQSMDKVGEFSAEAFPGADVSPRGNTFSDVLASITGGRKASPTHAETPANDTEPQSDPKEPQP